VRTPACGWLGLVGTRAADDKALEAARELAAAAVSAGYGVVSGGAMGVDAAGHGAALAAGGATLAVLAGGVDRPTPAHNARLFSAMLRGRGGFLSEHPPGTGVRRGSFPRRNRLIAALARAVVVVQARERSGSLSTAARARRLGRPLLAVPGGWADASRAGCHRLLREGALPVASVADLWAGLRALGLPAGSEDGRGRAPPLPSDPDAAAVQAAMLAGAKNLDDVVAATGLPIGRCLAALTALEVAGP